MTSDDAEACSNTNGAINLLFDAAASSTSFTQVRDELYGAGMALQFAGADLDLSGEVEDSLVRILDRFNERLGTTTEGVEPYWDVAKAHTDSPETGALAPLLEAAAEACHAVGYDWNSWSAP